MDILADDRRRYSRALLVSVGALSRVPDHQTQSTYGHWIVTTTRR